MSVWRVDGVARLRMRLARPAAEGARREALAPGRAQLPGLGVAVALRCESSIAIHDGLQQRSASRLAFLRLKASFSSVLMCRLARSRLSRSHTLPEYALRSVSIGYTTLTPAAATTTNSPGAPTRQRDEPWRLS